VTRTFLARMSRRAASTHPGRHPHTHGMRATHPRPMMTHLFFG
jgi:hypothetical protein